MINPQDLKTWLSCGQVAQKYKIYRQSVSDMCAKGRFTDDEAVNTSLGWLISPDAADRVWGYRTEVTEDITKKEGE